MQQRRQHYTFQVIVNTNLLVENVIQIKLEITIYVICTINIMYAKRIMIGILVHQFASVKNIVELIYIENIALP